MRRLSLILSIAILLISAVSAAEKKNQLEELFIWKMSDELKLSAVEEKKFTDTVRELNTKKATLNQDMTSSLDKIAKLKETKEKEAELTKYRKTLQNYGRIAEEEYDRLKPMLGTDRMAQYLLLKQDLLNRIRTMILNPTATKDSKPLPVPKVIEEK